MNLDMKVLEDFTLKEVIGEIPESSQIRKRLEDELVYLLKNLGSKNQKELQEALEQQKRVKRELDIRSGAMALSQEKIQMFSEAISKYIAEIEAKLSHGVSTKPH
ncbi:MAG TPA: hypothetical protein VNL34_02540 [Candidatus Nitrosotenuis sp.]|nr:hypothetical protein [Candidatus Nitrosotenuis sp.]